MNFGEVLTRAWSILWKYKILWLFGLFASLGGSSSNLRFENRVNNGTPLPGLENLTNRLPGWLIALLVLAALVIIIVLVLLSALARAGLARGAWLADGGVPQLTFSQLFAEGKTYFVRVLLLGLLIFGLSISLFLFFLVIGVGTLGVGLVCLLPLICLLIPAFILLGVVVDLAIIAITGENLGVIDGLRRAWEVVRANLAQVIGLLVAVVIINAVIGAIVGLPVAAIALPFVAAAMNGTGYAGMGLAISAVLFLLYLPILLAARALLTTYTEATWVVAFRRLTGRGAGLPESVEVPPQPPVE